jgi:hypothetical protein
MTSSGLGPATFRLVAQCLDHYATACPGSVFIEMQMEKQIGMKGSSSRRGAIIWCQGVGMDWFNYLSGRGWRCMGGGSTDLRTINLDREWRWAGSIRLRPSVLIGRKAWRATQLVFSLWRRETSQFISGNQTQAFQPSNSQPVTIPTEPPIIPVTLYILQ